MADTMATARMTPTMQATMMPMHTASQVRLELLPAAPTLEEREREREREGGRRERKREGKEREMREERGG